MSNTIQTAIIEKLKTVADIGHVFDHEPYYRQAQDLVAQYLRFGKIRGWSVVRDNLVETPATIGTLGVFQNSERTDWRILGFWEITDGGQSAVEFNDKLDAIRTVFRDDRGLNIPGLTTVTLDRAGIEIIDTGLAQFAGAICHSAILGLTTERHL